MYLEELQQPASLNETISFIIHPATAGIRCGARAASVHTFPSNIPDNRSVFSIANDSDTIPRDNNKQQIYNLYFTLNRFSGWESKWKFIVYYFGEKLQLRRKDKIILKSFCYRMKIENFQIIIFFCIPGTVHLKNDIKQTKVVMHSHT